MQVVQLFGGAITCNLPSEFEDISRVRDVPNHQEVLVHKTNDSSCIVEILEFVSEQGDALSALKFHWQELVQANSATGVQIEEVPMPVPQENINPTLFQFLQAEKAGVFAMTGYQNVSKFRESGEAANRIKIYLGLIRLPQYNTDILVSLNVPLIISEKSSSYMQTENGTKTDWNALFRNILFTFQIINPGLFG